MFCLEILSCPHHHSKMPFIIRSCPSSLEDALYHSVMPIITRRCLYHSVMPIITRRCPLSFGHAHHHSKMPFIIRSCPSSLVHTLPHLVMPIGLKQSSHLKTNNFKSKPNPIDHEIVLPNFGLRNVDSMSKPKKLTLS